MFCLVRKLIFSLFLQFTVALLPDGQLPKSIAFSFILFTYSLLPCHIALFTATYHYLYHFDLTRWPLCSPGKRPVMKMHIGCINEFLLNILAVPGEVGHCMKSDVTCQQSLIHAILGAFDKNQTLSNPSKSQGDIYRAVILEKSLHNYFSENKSTILLLLRVSTSKTCGRFASIKEYLATRLDGYKYRLQSAKQNLLKSKIVYEHALLK